MKLCRQHDSAPWPTQTSLQKPQCHRTLVALAVRMQAELVSHGHCQATDLRAPGALKQAGGLARRRRMCFGHLPELISWISI